VVETALNGSRASFRWSGKPRAFHATGDSLEIGAGPDTDLFIDPMRDRLPVLSAPRLLARFDGDVQFKARVEVGFATTFDAGVLVVWVDETNWAKLCFEQAPDGRFMVVSVVTRGRSDDANGFTVDDKEVWLRVSRLGGAFAFHAGTDGKSWQLVRHFAMFPVTRVAYGFAAQSPTGQGCTATFREISLRRARLADLRDGS
jgi:uncharacterized protein